MSLLAPTNNHPTGSSGPAWMDGWMPGWLASWMDAWMQGCMDGWMDGGREGGREGWMEGGTDGRCVRMHDHMSMYVSILDYAHTQIA